MSTLLNMGERTAAALIVLITIITTIAIGSL